MKYEVYLCSGCNKEERSEFTIRAIMPYDEVSSGSPKGWVYTRHRVGFKTYHEYFCSKACLQKNIVALVNMVYGGETNDFWVISR